MLFPAGLPVVVRPCSDQTPIPRQHGQHVNSKHKQDTAHNGSHKTRE